jgi:hypothetical protein
MPEARCCPSFFKILSLICQCRKKKSTAISLGRHMECLDEFIESIYSTLVEETLDSHGTTGFMFGANCRNTSPKLRESWD